jgi:hypothetical protein
MKAKLAYCARCNREVRLIETDLPLHGGQATLPDAPELICLECSARCGPGPCPLTNLAHVVMEHRIEQMVEQAQITKP